MRSVGSHSISGRENEGNGVGLNWEEIENNNVKIIITTVLVSVSCSPLNLHSPFQVNKRLLLEEELWRHWDRYEIATWDIGLEDKIGGMILTDLNYTKVNRRGYKTEQEGSRGNLVINSKVIQFALKYHLSLAEMQKTTLPHQLNSHSFDSYQMGTGFLF